MKIIADYHTHTKYSCGKKNIKHATGKIEENVKVAREKGLKVIGISDHGFGHVFYGLTRENALKARKEIDELNKKYKDIKILLGIESNIMNNKGELDIPDDIIHIFDYILAGYHYGSKPTSIANLLHHIDNFLFKGFFSKKYNTDSVINAMKKNNILYITHPGDKAEVDIEKIAKVAEETNTGLEINGHHNKLSVDMINKIKQYNIEYYLGSDAHCPENVGNLKKGIEILNKSDIDINKVKNIQE